MQFKKTITLALAMSCASAIAAPSPQHGSEKSDVVTQSSEGTKPGATVETMESLRSEIAVLKAQIDVAKARADLAAANHTASASISGLPEIVSIYGTSDSLTAILSMPDGAHFRASKGDHIHGGYLVVAIDHSGVIVERGKKRSALLFAPYSIPGQMQNMFQPGQPSIPGQMQNMFQPGQPGMPMPPMPMGAPSLTPVNQPQAVRAQ